MRKLVLLSLDAMFDQDLGHYAADSFMAQWMHQAAVCTKVKTVFPSLTYPAHTTLVTGCDAAQHGVGQNTPFQPDTEEAMRTWYWTAEEVHRESLFGAVKRQGGRCASILWPVTGKHPDIKWAFPEVLALPGENQVLKMLEYGTAPWILHMELKHGRKRVSTKEPHLSDYAVILAEDVITHHKPEFTAVHLVDLDDMRHGHGVDSKEAHDAMDRNERRVKTIWELMQRTKGMEDALLAIVTDHGQADVSKTIFLEHELKEAGFAGAVRVQSNGMSAYLYAAEQGAEGAARVEGWLREHGAQVGVSHVYSREEMDRLGCIAEPAFAVEAAENVVFCDGLPRPKRAHATHGYGPGHPAENCILAVRGKGIKPCQLPAMPMRDVAPTLAGLMGIDLPQAQGINHSNVMIL